MMSEFNQKVEEQLHSYGYSVDSECGQIVAVKVFKETNIQAAITIREDRQYFWGSLILKDTTSALFECSSYNVTDKNISDKLSEFNLTVKQFNAEFSNLLKKYKEVNI